MSESDDPLLMYVDLELDALLACVQLISNSYRLLLAIDYPLPYTAYRIMLVEDSHRPNPGYPRVAVP